MRKYMKGTFNESVQGLRTAGIKTTFERELDDLEFKEAFDKTTDAIDSLSDANNEQMFEMMNAVLDVQARDTKEVERIDKQSKLNAERTAILREKVLAGQQHKKDLHAKVTKMRQETNFLLLGDPTND